MFEKLAADSSGRERAWALAGLAGIQSDPNRSVSLARQALTLDPNLATAANSLANSESSLGHYEAGFQALKRTIALLERPDHGGLSEKFFAVYRHTAVANFDSNTGDYLGCQREELKGAEVAQDPRLRDFALSQAAFCAALLHEGAAALRMIGGQDDVTLTKTSLARGLGWGEINRLVSRDLKDWNATLTDVRAITTYLRRVDPLRFEAAIHERFDPGQVEALGMLSRLEEARAVAAGMPSDCYWCATARAGLADASGDYRRADHLWAQAIRMAPSLVSAYEWRAAWLLRRPDFLAATAAAREAVKVGPRNADAWEDWGEALAGRGDFSGAVRKYQEASLHAPRWGHLNLRWGEALARLGRKDEARAHFTAAAGMDLSAADRAELAAQKS